MEAAQADQADQAEHCPFKYKQYYSELCCIFARDVVAVGASRWVRFACAGRARGWIFVCDFEAKYGAPVAVLRSNGVLLR